MLLGDGENFKIDDIEPISIPNEIKVLQAIAASSEAMLKNFETTLEEDNKILKDPKLKLSMNLRNCVLMRRGEKEVYHFYIDMAKECIPFLQMPWKDLKRHAAKCYSTSCVLRPVSCRSLSLSLALAVCLAVPCVPLTHCVVLLLCCDVQVARVASTSTSLW